MSSTRQGVSSNRAGAGAASTGVAVSKLVISKVRDCISGQLGWCLGPKACRLCCSSLPPASESTSTRLLYLLLLAAGSVLMAAMLTSDVQHNLQSAFKDFNATCIDLHISDNCMLLTGYMALYKVSFGISMFFIGMAVLNLGVGSSSGVRASIHNGFWVWKLLILSFLCVTTFVIPVPHLDSFHTGWLYCALAGACVFLLIQIVLVTQAARCVSLPRPLSPPPSCPKLCLMLAMATVLTLAWVAAFAWLFFRFTGPECMSTNTIIVTCNAVLSILVTFLTLLPCTKKTTGGFVPAALQASIVCCYLVWLTWCTVTSTPDNETTRDPTEEYFHERGIQIDLGPYHAGLDPYHDLDLPRHIPDHVPNSHGQGQCGAGYGGGVVDGEVLDMWVPYTAIIIMFTVLTQESTIISFSKSWSTVILKTVSTWLSVLVYMAMLVTPHWRSQTRTANAHGSGQIPADMWASEETACLQTSHI